MTPSRLAAVVVLACLVTAGCGAKPPAEPPPEETFAYVALGDSFTAVAGTGPYANPVCRRSKDDYPALVAAERGITSFADASCGGAQTADLTGAQVVQGAGVNQPQLNDVSADTELVTVGIGLNDPVNDAGTQLSYVLLSLCLPEKGGAKRSDACEEYLKLPDSALADAVDVVADRVAAALDRIKVQAPQARIIFVGYPRVLPDQGDCPAQLPLPPLALARVRSTGLMVNRALERVATKAGAEFVDMYAASRGHDICSEDPWVNGKKAIRDKAEAFHPYKAYHQAVAAKIVALLGKEKPQA